MNWQTIFVLLGVTAFQVMAVLFAFRAIRHARTPQGAVGWVVFLLAAPHLAVPVFLFLGHKRLSGYVAMRRDMRESIAQVTRQITRNAPADLARLGPRQEDVRAFEALAMQKVLSGNLTTLLIDGPAAFGGIFEAIDAAERYVLVEFYTLRDDELGRDLARHLIDCARRGVQVRVIYDGIGSVGLPSAYLANLRGAGVQISNFHARRRSRNRFQINFRNHRKIVVVDGETGFIGGLNVGDEYMGRSRKFGHWRDTHMRIDGPAVAQLQLAFAEDWHWATAETPDLNWRPARHEGGRDCLILATGPSDAVETGSLYFLNAINAASNRLWIATPYFVPDVDILNALKLAALRGVDVRLLVPDKRDHWLVWLAAFSYFDEVRPVGVKIYRYLDGFMHSKALVVDDWMGSVGTVNLDNRSCRLNFEATALIFDPGFAEEVATMFEDDLAVSELYETDFNDIPHRLIRYTAPFARLFAPIL